MIERIDFRAQGTDRAGFDYSLDRLPRAREYRFYGPVSSITGPAFQAPLTRMMLDKGAESDALHSPSHNDVFDDASIAHVYGPIIPDDYRLCTGVSTITQL